MGPHRPLGQRQDMHQTETRALRRAVIALMIVSTGRWAWAHGNRPEPVDGGVREALVDESKEMVDEERERAEPLGSDERIDPNRADEIQLDRLPGVGPVTARAILEARDAGAVFRRTEDLTTVAGIGPATIEELDGLLDLDDPPSRSRARFEATMRNDAPGGAGVDVNRATAEELETLPGIGPALARRILDERRKRMFSSVADLERVRGIGPATVERLRDAARVGGRL
ncbi:MAG: helix-hairpin-helix domain-containing protein [Gemmatimonadota bacterium]|nr:helix-hairpin-helix domain-containing protein [Gemmatimonadota bacterium]